MANDALNRRTQTIDALGASTTTLYDAVGNLSGVIDPSGNRTTFSYDALDRLSQRTDPLGNRSTLAYDAASRLTSPPATERRNTSKGGGSRQGVLGHAAKHEHVPAGVAKTGTGTGWVAPDCWSRDPEATLGSTKGLAGQTVLAAVVRSLGLPPARLV